MDQLDRRTKLLIVGGVCLLLMIGIIVLAVSCSAARKREPEPTPVVDISPIPESTPAPTQSLAPIATPSPTPEAVTAPTLPTASPTLTPEAAAPTDNPAVTTPELPNNSSGSNADVTNSAASKPVSTSSAQAEDTTTPVFDFGLPAAASVGAQVVVNPASRNVTQVSWTVGKAGLFGIPTGGTYQGTLNANGGSIVFDAPGTYTLTATAKSSAGETVTVSQDIEILPVGKFGFGLPKTAYTDTVVDVEVLGGVEGSVTWHVQKDGQEMPLANAFAGTLTDTGGFITFREAGTYTLTGQTDGGKPYEADITVYPLMKIPFTVPATTYRNTEISVKMGEADLQGQSIQWSVKQNGRDAEYAGTLTDAGGSISFASLGDYQITASAADTYTGRVFSQTRQIRVVNRRPNAPEGTAVVTAQRSNGKVLVEFAATAADPDGDEVTLEWMGRGDDYFGVGVHTVRVRARDSVGDDSAWTPVAFEVPNAPPDAPVGMLKCICALGRIPSSHSPHPAPRKPRVNNRRRNRNVNRSP